MYLIKLVIIIAWMILHSFTFMQLGHMLWWKLYVDITSKTVILAMSSVKRSQCSDSVRLKGCMSEKPIIISTGSKWFSYLCNCLSFLCSHLFDNNPVCWLRDNITAELLSYFVWFYAVFWSCELVICLASFLQGTLCSITHPFPPSMLASLLSIPFTNPWESVATTILIKLTAIKIRLNYCKLLRWHRRSILKFKKKKEEKEKKSWGGWRWHLIVWVMGG